MPNTSSKELVVVKFGSDLIANGHGVDTDKIDRYAVGLAKRLEQHNLIVVTSGAIAAGKAIAGESGHTPESFSHSVLAGIGSSAVMHAWQDAFGKHNVLTASFLVTHHEIGDEHEGNTLKETLAKSLDSGVVPVINENDALSDIEIMALLTGGDNDGLAAHLAHTMGAHGLRLFTVGGGLRNQYNQHIPVVNSSNINQVRVMLGERRKSCATSNGRGGMVSKVEAAWRFASCSDEDGRWAEIAKPSDDMLGSAVTRVLS